MSRTITAMFDTRADAESARDRLSAADIDAASVNIHDQSSEGFSSESYSSAKPAERGIWASIKHAFLPDEDRHTYEEGIRRGGVVLTADVDSDGLDRAVAALENSNTIDIDERASEWRASGWTGSETSRSDTSDALITGRRDSDRGTSVVRSYSTDRTVSDQMNDYDTMGNRNAM